MKDEKEEIVSEVLIKMNLDNETSNKLKNILYLILHDYSVTAIKETGIIVREEEADMQAIRMFFVSKRVQGCTDRTLSLYKDTIRQFLNFINKPLKEIVTNDIRYYLAIKKERDKNSDTQIDNVRRILSSFFGWLMEEEYIQKNPVAKIKKVRVEKYIKKAFKETEIERLRVNALGDLRLTALIELLLSTGCRISEVYNMNIEDVDGDEIIVKGKGKKERIVYLNAKAKIALDRYLDTREDDNSALFVSELKPHNRLKISGMGSDIRRLGEKAKVNDTHPHRFRRTAATLALNRGMPIDQVQTMLGHSSIETTTIYATSAQDVVKQNHRKYVI